MSENRIFDENVSRFENNTFSEVKWSAPWLQEPSKVKSCLEQYHLIGRRLVEVRLIGLCYSLSWDELEDVVYQYLKHLPEEERQRLSEYKNILPTQPIGRHARIDEPILLRFEDGDMFAMVTPMDSEYRMSMNDIPWDIQAGVNLPNVDANVLFSPWLGQRIVDVEVNTHETDRHPFFLDPFEEPPFIRELVSDVILWFENGTGLFIEGWLDYCCITCVDRKKDSMYIEFGELRPVLPGDYGED